MSARTRRYIVGLFLVLQGLDILITYAGLRNGAVEVNPFAVRVMAEQGEFLMYGLKAAIVFGVLGVVLATSRRLPRVWLSLRVANVLYVLVVAINATAVL